jgi:polyphosphate kinase 2 (PPK2 family)
MEKEIGKYLATPGKKVSLKDYQTTYNGDQEKEDGKQELEEIKEKLSKLQETLYAANAHSVLISFSGDGCGRKRQRNLSCDVWVKPTGMPGIQF